MINVNQQLDKVIAEQFAKIQPMLDSIEDGLQKDFLINTLKGIKENRTGDASEFIEQFAKIKGEAVDIEKLKEMAKNSNNGS